VSGAPIEEVNGEGDRKEATSNGGEQDWHAVCFSDDVIERLNDLLRVELATVAGYQKALRTLKNKAVVDTDHILQLASDHQRTVAALQGSVHARGGAPVIAADSWAGSGDAALTAEDATVRMESKLFVGALLEVERRGLAEYEASLTSLDEDARELVKLELIPRQKRHVAGLSALLVQLAA
jgi:bacterioferritin (cytochrome b1)